ncbi:MAG TPA: transcription termination/antitermination NusG family protein [Planctomycetota bacterium]|nr:transcription termination/antitermination NusG family protein [Planctomycetota bacterium]
MQTRHKASEALQSPALRAFERFDHSVAHWAALRTSARWEKTTAECLAQANIGVYLPLWTRICRYKTRKNISEVPLFAGYVFFDEQRLDELSTRAPSVSRYIAQVLKPADHQKLKDELHAIAELVGNQRLVQERIYGTVGERVRITRGAFREFEGTITRLNSETQRLVLNVSYLGLSVEVEVEEFAVEKVL